MASSDIPANNKGDEQHLNRVSDASNVETVKSKSTPPPNTESGNKRKRESKANKDTKSPKDVDTKETGEKHVPAVETVSVKEVEMKDAESKDSSVDNTIKEIDMKDAEVVCNKTDVDEGETHPVDSKEDEQPTKVERSERERNDEDGSGQHVLGEVATLLKQVQESDTKAKLEVEVKVKKMEDGDVKENREQDPIRERVGLVAHD